MITTNLVVALMIVSNGMQQVQAIDVTGVKFKDGFSHTCYFTPDEVKTMYVPATITSFVYSTTVPTDYMHWSCSRCRQSWGDRFDPSDFLGKEINELWFRGMPDKLCRGCRELDNGVSAEHKREHDEIMNILRTVNGANETQCKFCKKWFYWSDLGCVKTKEKP